MHFFLNCKIFMTFTAQRHTWFARHSFLWSPDGLVAIYKCVSRKFFNVSTMWDEWWGLRNVRKLNKQMLFFLLLLLLQLLLLTLCFTLFLLCDIQFPQHLIFFFFYFSFLIQLEIWSHSQESWNFPTSNSLLSHEIFAARYFTMKQHFYAF